MRTFLFPCRQLPVSREPAFWSPQASLDLPILLRRRASSSVILSGFHGIYDKTRPKTTFLRHLAVLTLVQVQNLHLLRMYPGSHLLRLLHPQDPTARLISTLEISSRRCRGRKFRPVCIRRRPCRRPLIQLARIKQGPLS